MALVLRQAALMIGVGLAAGLIVTLIAAESLSKILYGIATHDWVSFIAAPLAIALVMNHATQAFDAGRLAQNIMVAAWAHGVGSCIASLFPDENERQAKALLGVPTERSMQTAISLGYPADAAALRLRSAPPGTRATVPTGRKALDELVSWERYGRHARS